jgi:hypothetical protein
MATIMDSYEEKVGSAIEAKVLESAAIPVRVSTTLYDLIAAIQDAVGPGVDTRVVATVVRMLYAGYIALPGDIDLKIREQEGDPAMPQ